MVSNRYPQGGTGVTNISSHFLSPPRVRFGLEALSYTSMAVA